MAQCAQGARGRGQPRLYQTSLPRALRCLPAAQGGSPQTPHRDAKRRSQPPIRSLGGLLSGPTTGATGTILGGGASRRMGRDKLPLKVGDMSLLERVHEALASRCAEILIVGGGCVSPETRRVSDLRSGHQGPLAGIEAALLAARYRT